MRLAPLALLLASCQGAPVVYNPSEPVPTSLVEGVVNAQGKGDVKVDSPIGPLAQLFKWEGDVTLRIRSERPWLVVEENFESEEGAEPVEVIDEPLVEPSPGNEKAALDAVERGDVVILRKGKPSQLDAPGSIAARKARRFPAATPAKPEPVSSIVEFPPCPPGTECVGGICRVPEPCVAANAGR